MPVDARGLALGVLATLATAFALSWAQTFLVPLLLGIVITYTLSPVVFWLERMRIPRAAGTVIVMATRRRCAGAGRLFAARTAADHHRAAADRNGEAFGFAGGTAHEPARQPAENPERGDRHGKRHDECSRRIGPAAGHARDRRTTEVQAQRLPVARFDGRHRRGRPGGDGRVPGVLPAAGRRYVQAKAGAACRPHIVEAEDHGHHPRRHQRLDPEVHADAGRHQPAGRPAQLAGAPLHRPRKRRCLGRRGRPAAHRSLSRARRGRWSRPPWRRSCSSTRRRWRC